MMRDKSEAVQARCGVHGFAERVGFLREGIC
jgi:hypothetical protein